MVTFLKCPSMLMPSGRLNLTRQQCPACPYIAGHGSCGTAYVSEGSVGEVGSHIQIFEGLFLSGNGAVMKPEPGPIID